jgi:hypothetical protein
MHYAALGRDATIVRVLMAAATAAGDDKRASKLISTATWAGMTPLHYAVWTGAHAQTQALMSYDASLLVATSASDSEWASVEPGSSPLHLAAARGDERMAALLLTAFLQNRCSIVPAHTPGARPPPPPTAPRFLASSPPPLARCALLLRSAAWGWQHCAVLTPLSLSLPPSERPPPRQALSTGRRATRAASSTAPTGCRTAWPASGTPRSAG